MHRFTFSQFIKLYPTDEACLEEIKEQRFPEGIYCSKCKAITKHYKIQGRPVYSCKFCRTQTYPLSGTLFDKSSTPLRIWFLALFLITQTRDGLSSEQLQKELGVTYKTAWRMRKSIRSLAEQNQGDLLKESIFVRLKDYKERKWVFFNKFEIKVVHKQEHSDDEV
jgi:transposase-like protein